MTGAGNDIVSLGAANSGRTKRPAFYKKILTESEIKSYDAVTGYIAFENYVWLLWSVKEAAYKCLQRFNPGLIFSPTRFIIQTTNPPTAGLSQNFSPEYEDGTGFDHKTTWAGSVAYEDHVLFSRSLVNHNVILSTVQGTKDFKHVYWGLQTVKDALPASQSAAVRSLLLTRLKSVCPGRTLHIDKNKYHIPVITDGLQELPIPVSLTHHEKYIAYAFYMNNLMK